MRKFQNHPSIIMHNKVKVHNTTMTERWKKCLDSNGACGAFLTHLLKALDCLQHSLLMAKIHAYGFDKTSTEYLKADLSHRKQRIKINKAFTNWKNIIHGVPQGSILSLNFLMSFFVISLCLYQIWSW